jgi:hypothetical protein
MFANLLATLPATLHSPYLLTSSAATTNKASMGAAIQMELARGKQRGERETGKENVRGREKE